MKRILALILLLSACTKDNDSVDIQELDIEEDEFTSENSKWINFSPIEDNREKVIFTPFVLVNENGQHQNEALPLEGDLAKELENKINEVKDGIQHKEKQAE